MKQTYVLFTRLWAGAFCLNAAAQRRGGRPGLVWSINVGLAVVVAVFMAVVSQPRMLFDDFRKAYYPAGYFIFHDPAALYEGNEPNFVNLPVVAILFAPFSALNYPSACLAFTVMGLVATAGTCVLLLRMGRHTTSRRLALVGLFLVNGPLYYSLREGNSTHFVLLLLVGSMGCLQSGRDFWCGALLAVCGLLKPFVWLLAVYFLLRRRWRVTAGVAAVVAITLTASLALAGVELHRVWLAHCIGPYATRPMTAYNVQSLSSVLARLLTPGDVGTGWKPVEVGVGFKVLRLLLLTGLVAAVAAACLRPVGADPRATQRLEFCIVLCLALLTSPVSWTHYYLLLLLPAGLFLGGLLPVSPRGRWAAVLVAGLALTSPPVITIGSNAPVARLLASHYWAGGLVVLGALALARWRAKDYGAALPSLVLAEHSRPRLAVPQTGMGPSPARAA